MAERALVSVAGGIIGSVTGPLVAEQFKLYRGFKKELWKLESTVKAIEAVLEDAEAKQVQNYAVRDWLGKLSDVLYEADDLLDSVSTEALQRKVMTQGKKFKKVRIFFFKSKKLFNDLRMANKIKDIREKLDHIKDERNFHLAEGSVERRVRFSRDTAAYLGDEIPIGREDDRKAILERLDANDELDVSIVSIVGIGGLGKTSLAKFIFNDDEYTQKFDQKFWVCVSDEFDVKILIKKIVGNGSDEMTKLVDRLREKINGKRYFLVLDDVWNEDHGKWSELKSYLKSNVKGSKILVTTRSTKVANVMHTYRYELKGLDEYKSWDLFKQTAFENPELSVDAIVENTGREIVRKCRGVPLAVKTIGWLLGSQSFEKWSSFRDKELSSLSQNPETSILPTLKLSYNKLPSRLKQCFAYCSLFPRDHRYDKLELINQWMAQGFVESRVGQCLEDIAEEYFMDLLSGSFFQEVNLGQYGDIISCKMHDLMHDLAISVAGSLISVVGDKNRETKEKTRYFAVHDCRKFPSIDQLFASNANMIRAFHHFEFLCSRKCVYLSLCSHFKNLRELELSDRDLESVPSFITEMKHLRYLNLSNNNFNQLPKFITRLPNLQTLILDTCRSLTNLPRGFEKLISLRHLNLRNCHSLTYMPQGFGRLSSLQTLILDTCHSLKNLPRGFGKLVNLLHLNIRNCDSLRYMPKGFGQLTSLQRLTYFVVDSNNSGGGLNELNQLNNLRGDLVIKGLSHMRDSAEKYKCMNLRQKSGLHSLRLEWSEIVYVNDSVNDVSSNGIQPPPTLKCLYMDEYPYSRIPTRFSSLTSLVNFRLVNGNRCQYVSTLSQLPCLKKLGLCFIEGLEYISEYHDRSRFPFFPTLDDLEIIMCPNLKGWWKRGSSIEGESDDQITEVSSVKEHLPHSSCNSPMTHQPICLNLEKLTINFSSLMFYPTTTPLTKLKSLKIINFLELETLPEDFGQNLPSLEELVIWHCLSLKVVHPIQHLIGLTHLEFEQCPRLELDDVENGMQWQGPTTLQTLFIENCDGLTAIPKWIANCKSLEVLRIRECSCFDTQRIKETGEDWPKIIHIPNFTVEDCLYYSVEVDVSEEVEVADSETHSKVTLNELNQLNNLRGDLVIKGLSHMRDSAKKYELMNLKQKSQLHSLHLEWNEIVYVNDSVNEVSSNSIQPPPSLKCLYMDEYPYSRIPTRFSSLTSLVNFRLVNGNRCQYVSTLSQLPCLKKLELCFIEGLEYISEYHDRSRFPFFPMLDDLEIIMCPNLKGWWKRGTSVEGESDQITEVSSVKEHLPHSSCNSPMTHQPICLNLEKLTINFSSLTFYPATTPLTKLKSLKIINFLELETLPEDFGQNLPSLKELVIGHCLSLKVVHPIRHLTGLTHLEFEQCPRLELDDVENGMQWQGPTTLRTLFIENCDGFTAIPKWIENCKSLEVLRIRECSCFDTQRIKEIGEDWTKIVHIPRFTVEECHYYSEVDVSEEEADSETIHSEASLNLQVEETPEKRGVGLRSLFKGLNNCCNKSITEQ